MSDSGKAVFLSYASQDAEAAKRIAEALRAAGVEVWFDQNELVGGDAWDAKIRKQIKECALFVPIISANTQARREGYFRLEWRLAVERMRQMDDDLPFLLPVVIDGTKDAEAFVPDKFREVQWTRVRLDESPTELAARVARLLGGEVLEAGRPRPAERGEGTAPPSKRKTGLEKWWWLIFPIMGMSVPIIGMLKRPSRPHPEPPPGIVSGQPAQPQLSEARQLTQRARALLDKIDSTANDFAVAESLAKRAIELDPTDGEVWAVSSRINSAYLTRGFERGDMRRNAALSQAERAVKLAPESPEAWLALGRANFDSNFARADEAIRHGLKLAPNDGRLLLALASSYRRQDRFDEAMTLYQRAAVQPDVRALALYNQHLIHFFYCRFSEAERCIRDAITLVPTSNMVAGLAMLEVTWRGNVVEARRLLANAPAEIRNQPRIVYASALVALMAHESHEALQALHQQPADYINDAWFTGPKGLLVGFAHAQLGNKEAARIAWESGLAVVKRRLDEAPNDSEAHLRRGELLGWLGQDEEAMQEARVFNELRRRRSTDWTDSPARIYAAIGRADLAVPELTSLIDAPPTGGRWPLTRALLRLDPLWDKLRGDPRFQKLCEEQAIKPAVPATKIDDKSVAVLAFANLSDDKANEYFSDGISEELLNVLAKVPGLKVSARTSAFYFKGKETPIPEIAQKLGVAYVVEGSVRKAGDKVRITAQLIKAADGFHVWSDTFTRDLKDIFAVQDEIAGKVAKSLTDKLGMNMPASTSTNIDAYNVYLQARSNLANRTIGSLRLAVEQFETALKLDPAYAPARAGLAKTLMLIPMFTRSYQAAMNRQLIDRCLREAEAVIATNPENAEAWIVLGFVEANYNWRWKRVIEAVEKALALAPNDAEVVNFAGDCLRIVRDRRRMLEVERRALDLNPLGSFNHWDLAFANISDRNFELAARHAREALAMKADSVEAYFTLIWSLGKLRRFDEMRAALAGANRDVKEADAVRLNLAVNAAVLEGRMDEARRLLEQNAPSAEQGLISPAERSFLYLLIGEPDQAAYWLKRAIANRDVNLVYEEPIELARFAAEPKTRFILEVPEIRELLEIRERFSREAGK